MEQGDEQVGETAETGMLSAEFPGEAAGRNTPCRQVCEGDKDEGPRFRLQAEVGRRA